MPTNYLQLLDWRRRIAELYVELRSRPSDAATLAWFRAEKDNLFTSHPQSPVPVSRRESFTGLGYWPYDPGARLTANFVSLEEAPAEIPVSTDEELPLINIGRLEFSYGGQPCQLGAFWVAGYGGGLFVPFRDDTSGQESYGGGRYLLDTIKSADFGSDYGKSTVELDFNYAYHPSCCYDPAWTCPLAPPGNRLSTAIRAGERLPAS